MALTIQDFRNISGSSKSIGYVARMNGDDRLVKLEAHRHLRNVKVEDVVGADHAQTRLDFLAALKAARPENLDGAHGQRFEAFIEAVKAMLCIEEDEDGGLTAENKPLDRRDVRSVLKAFDLALADYDAESHAFVTVGGGQVTLSIGPKSTQGELLDAYATVQLLRKTAGAKINVEKMNDALECHFCANVDRFGGCPMLTKMLANYPKVGLTDHGVETQHVRTLATNVLSAVFGGKLQKADLQGVSASKLQGLARDAALGTLTFKGLGEELEEKDELELTNCGEVLDIVSKFDRAKDEEKSSIVLTYRQPQPVVQPQVQQPEVPERQYALGRTMEDIQSFLADLISDSDTLATDNEHLANRSGGPYQSLMNCGNHVLDVIRRHHAEAAVFLKDGSAYADVLKGLPDGFVTLFKSVKDSLAKLLTKAGGNVSESFETISNRLAALTNDLYACRGIALAMSKTIGLAVKSGAAALQVQIGQQFAEISGQADVPVNLDEIIGGKTTGTKSLDDILSKLSQRPQVEGALQVNAKHVDDDLGSYDVWELTLPGGRKVELEKGEIADASPRTAAGILKSERTFKHDQECVKTRRENQKAGRLECGRYVLEHLSGLLASDSRHGYGALMTKVMSTYFSNMTALDKRSLIAAAIRFRKPDKVAQSDDPAEIQKVEAENLGAKLGAVLKGAGPIMQKMLQGLASMNLPASFKLALEDMRSNLAPIPEKIVQAELLELKRQNPDIASIDVLESKGAASVGQTFLCRVLMKDGTAKEEIIKMIRPDAELRCQRERQVFEEAAREVDIQAALDAGHQLGAEEQGGMQITFAGQLAGILDELDLRIEAENVRKGAVYDDKAHGLSSMKLDPAFKPTKFTMVVTKASGDPLDRVIGRFRTEIAALKKPFETDVAEAGNHQKSAERMLETAKKLTVIHQKLLVHQSHLVQLAGKWCDEGIYKGGFYHGDLHAGNIMVDTGHFEEEGGFLKRKVGKNGAPGPLDLDADEGLTVIDFGNAEALRKEDRVNVLRMIAAAAARDTTRFMDGFKALMTPEGQAKFEAQRPQLHDMIHNVLNLGKMSQSGNRIAVVLGALQQLGFELPAPIFRFSQCQVRLQGTIDEVNELLDQVAVDLSHLQPKSMRRFRGLKGLVDPLARFLYGDLGVRDGNMDKTIDVQIGKLDSPLFADTILEKLLRFSGPDCKPTLQENLDLFSHNIDVLRDVQPGGTELKEAFDSMRTSFSDEKAQEFMRKTEELNRLSGEALQLEQEIDVIQDASANHEKAQTLLQLYDRFRGLPNIEERAGTFLNQMAQALIDTDVATTNDSNEVRERALNACCIDALCGVFTQDELALVMPHDQDGRCVLPEGVSRHEFGDLLTHVETGNRVWFVNLTSSAQENNTNVGRLPQMQQTLDDKNGQINVVRNRIDELKGELKHVLGPVVELYRNAQKAVFMQLKAGYQAIANNLDLTEKDDFCTVLGGVIKNNKGSSLWDLGFATVVEYTLTGKL